MRVPSGDHRGCELESALDKGRACLAFAVHQPNHSARLVGLEVHAHTHVGDAAAVRGDLRVRDPLQIEHIDGLERGLGRPRDAGNGR